jgi:hypothetical protein
MQPECYLCGDCRNKNKNHTGLDVQDGQWLEEMGDMIEAAVQRIRKEQSFSGGCYGKLATS